MICEVRNGTTWEQCDLDDDHPGAHMKHLPNDMALAWHDGPWFEEEAEVVSISSRRRAAP